MRKKMSGKFLSVIIAAVLLITLVPLVSAFEAHTINVKVRVKERFNCIKTARLAESWEIDESGIIFPSPPHGADNLTNPFNVPIYTCVVWVVRITLTNTDNYCYTEVVVKDNFSTEITGEPALEEVPVDVIVRTQTRGMSQKESFQSQTRILWYVTCEDWDAGAEECNDNSGLLCPGDSAFLEMLVWTKLNPSGKQSYTSSGNYTLNSGPTAKWLSVEDGHQSSSCGPSVHIYAYD